MATTAARPLPRVGKLKGAMSDKNTGATPTNASLAAAFVAVVNAAVGLVVSFGIDLTAAQQANIMALVNAFVILIVALLHVLSSREREKERLMRERWSHLEPERSEEK